MPAGATSWIQPKQRVPGNPQALCVFGASAHHHVVLLGGPSARAVGGEDRLFFHADVGPRLVGKPLDLVDNGL